MENSIKGIRSKIKETCAKIFFWGIFISQIVKATFYGTFAHEFDTALVFVPDLFCIVLIYYIYLFWHARRGMVLGVHAKTEDLEKFPGLRYAKITAIIGAILAAAPLTLRALYYALFEGQVGIAHFTFYMMIFGTIFVLAFLILYLNFYIAYLVAKRHVGQPTGSEGGNNS